MRRLAERLLRERPEVRSLLVIAPNVHRIERSFVVRSPTKDPERQVVLWSDDGEPSLGFGSFHTHASVWEWNGKTIEGLLLAILGDQIVLASDPEDGHTALVDLADAGDLVELLTSRHWSDRAQLCSWSGAADREVSVESFGADADT
jgi:hypothetical protein